MFNTQPTKPSQAYQEPSSILKPIAIEPYDKIKNVQACGYIVELGSNTQAAFNLKNAREALAHYCSQIEWSTEYVNPDYTATLERPKPDFTNQCGYLKTSQFNIKYETHLAVMIQLSKLAEHEVLKHFQTDFSQSAVHRPASDNAQLPTQLSAAKPSCKSLASSNHSPKDKSKLFLPADYIKKYQIIIDIDVLAVITSEGMIALSERYPFKSHEIIGLNELHAKGVFAL